MNRLLVIALFSGLTTTTHAKVVDVIDAIRVTPVVIDNYSKVDINMDWSAKAAIEVGDTFSVGLPSQMETFNTTTKMHNQLNEEIGDCQLVGQNFTCTFTKANAINGTIGFERAFFDSSIIAPNTLAPTIYTQNGIPHTTVDMTISPALVNSREILIKSGRPVAGLTVGERLDWYIRGNCRGDTINNLKLTDDVLGDGHQIVTNTVYVLEGRCNASGFIWERDIVNSGIIVDPMATYTTTDVTLNSANTSKAYVIGFQTEILSAHNKWENQVTLTGDGVNEAIITNVANQNVVVIGNQIGLATGVVFLDSNNNGIFDTGEGIANIDVAVTDSTGIPITVTTDAEGNWTATVQAGNVVIEVNIADPDMPANIQLAIGDNPTVIAVPGNGVGSTRDGFTSVADPDAHPIPTTTIRGLLALFALFVFTGLFITGRKQSKV